MSVRIPDMKCSYSVIALLLLLSPSAFAWDDLQSAFVQPDENGLYSLDSTQSQADEIKTTGIQLELSPVENKGDNELIDSDEVPKNLKVIGKGVTEKNNSHSLVIACVGTPETGGEPGCNQLRVVEFDGDRNPHWNGKAFEIKSSNTFNATLKKAYKKKYRLHFLRVKKDPTRNGKAAKILGKGMGYGLMIFLIDVWSTPGGIIIAHSALAGMSMILAPFALLFILEAAHVDVIGGTANLILAPFRGLGNAMSFDYTSSLTATNGWNWVSDPTEVSPKKYRKIKALLGDFSNGVLQQK